MLKWINHSMYKDYYNKSLKDTSQKITSYTDTDTAKKDNLIYSRRQGKTTYNLLITESGKLVGNVTASEKTQRSLPIKSMLASITWDKSKKRLLIKALKQSYFALEGAAIVIHPRGAGGWGTGQHEGIEPEGKKGEGTFDWAQDAFEMFYQITRGNFLKIAKIIARADEAVDSGLTSPFRITDPEAQSWHFNSNKYPWGTEWDSRIQHL